MFEWLAQQAQQAPQATQFREISFHPSGAELMLLVAGGLFTVGLLTLFIVVLTRELKKEKKLQASSGGDSDHSTTKS